MYLWGHTLWGSIAMTILLVAGIALVAWAANGAGSTERRREANDFLAERFARGEISADEYQERRRVLESRSG